MQVVERVVPKVGLIMGSESDWRETMRHTAETLDRLGIMYEKRVVSAHRTPDDLFEYAGAAEREGLTLIIAGAGGAAHLPGMTASKTIIPVIGVPVIATPLKGLDALLSIMQMPAEVGVATVNVGPSGAIHAALFAATILAREDSRLYAKLRDLREDLLRDTKAPTLNKSQPSTIKVAVLAESPTQFEIMKYAEEQLTKLGIDYTRRVFHPETLVEELLEYTRAAEQEGTAAFIAASERGIDLAGKIAKTTMMPVLGVPIVSKPIERIDLFLEPFLHMPSGVAAFAIGRAGAINAALFAATILSSPSSKVRTRLREMRREHGERVRAMKI